MVARGTDRDSAGGWPTSNEGPTVSVTQGRGDSGAPTLLEPIPLLPPDR